MNATANATLRVSGFLATLVALGICACAAPTDDSSQSGSALGQASAPGAKFIDKTEARAGEFIVVLAPTFDIAAETQSLVAKYKARVFHTYDTVLHGFAATMTEADARTLAQEPSVLFVERNGIKHTSEVQQNATWGIDRVDQASLPLDKRYNYTLTGEGVNAVVIDTGVDARHPDFGGRVKPGFNALTTGSPDDASDVHGHGTHVGGTIGSNTWGLAKKVNIVPVRVCNSQGQCTDADIIRAVEWVTRNVAKPAVVNMSLGGVVEEGTQAVEEAIKASVASGITYVVAAGNDSKDACGYSPARMPEVISTGATGGFFGASDGKAFFSNFGSCVDIFAPGARIVSAKHNSTTSTAMDGTSMASPHVAGVVALLLQSVPTATPAQMYDLIRRNATNSVTGGGAGSPTYLLHLGANPILTP